MTALLFVFGALKQGFGGCHLIQGQRLPGDFVSVAPHPLFIVGPGCRPWLLERPGQGLRVRGQLFEVDEAALAALERLEGVGDPQGTVRGCVRVRPALDAAAPALQACVHFGSEAGFASQRVHAGPLAEYTLALAEHYRADAR